MGESRFDTERIDRRIVVFSISPRERLFLYREEAWEEEKVCSRLPGFDPVNLLDFAVWSGHAVGCSSSGTRVRDGHSSPASPRRGHSSESTCCPRWDQWFSVGPQQALEWVRIENSVDELS